MNDPSLAPRWEPGVIDLIDQLRFPARVANDNRRKGPSGRNRRGQWEGGTAPYGSHTTSGSRRRF